MIRLVCRKNGADSRVFTDGKIYTEVSFAGNLVGILDDFGTLRFVLPDEPSPHLVVIVKGRSPFLDRQRVVGVFETVKEG